MSSETTLQHFGVVKGIAHRPHTREPMTESEECTVVVGRGLTAEDRPAGEREVTLLSMEAWGEVCRELRAELPWHTRRANLLIEGLDLAATIDQTISIGPVRLEIRRESKPCKLMDELHPGLRHALTPQCRGGVAARVLSGGKIRVGDRATIEAK